MDLSGLDYRRQMQALLPRGAAWPRAIGTTLTRFLDGAAEEFARIAARVRALFEEADPRTTTELLADWERVADLPDNCSGTLRDTLQGRRMDLVAKLTSTGGASRAYFIAVAATLGYEITIDEFDTFRVGESAVGDGLHGDAWAYTWRVNTPETTVTYFRAGLSSVGEPLARWGNAALECKLRQLKPAHTILQFAATAGLSVLLLTEGTPISLLSGENLNLASAGGPP